MQKKIALKAKFFRTKFSSKILPRFHKIANNTKIYLEKQIKCAKFNIVTI